MAALLLIGIPLIGLLIVNLPGMRRLGFWGAVAFSAFQASLVFWMAPESWKSDLLPFASQATFEPLIDNLSLVLFLSIAIVAFIALLVSRSFFQDRKRYTFSSLILLSMMGMNGVVLASDLFVLYIFLEITAVTSFILIALDRKRDGFEGAFKYLILSAVATAMLLAAIALFTFDSASLAFLDLSVSKPWTPLMGLATALFCAGLLIKSGSMPFHAWVPDAYASAPAPISVLLAGIITKVTGVYTLIRVSTVIFAMPDSLKTIFLVVGTISILLAALAAINQSDLKRMLAYSSISQIGYIVLGLGAGTELALAGAILHLFNHAIFKSLLFVNAAAVEAETGTTDMKSLGGLSVRMPITGASSVVALLSTAGIPPFAGFWSKLIIVIGVWKAGYIGYASTAIIASLLTLGYFLVMQRKVFFGKVSDACLNVREASPWITIPAAILATITIVLGLATPWLFNTFILPIRSFL